VVSTLAENDQVHVSSMPGETVECQRFWLHDLFVFYDTPGFQNAREALPELAPAAVGRSNWPDPYFNGMFDEFRIYSGVLSDTQVAASFAAGPNMSSGTPPLLGVVLSGNTVQLSWPTNASGFNLESATNLQPVAIWNPVTNAPVPQNGAATVTLPITNASRFFRLRDPLWPERARGLDDVARQPFVRRIDGERVLSPVQQFPPLATQQQREGFIGDGLRLTLIGVVIGLVAGVAFARVLSSFLFQIGLVEPFTMVAVAVLLTAVALTACYIPARRATRVDPTVALRYE